MQSLRCNRGLAVGPVPRSAAGLAPIRPAASRASHVTRAATTSWAAWTELLPGWESSTRDGLKVDPAITAAIGKQVVAAAAGFKPKAGSTVVHHDTSDLSALLRRTAESQLSSYLNSDSLSGAKALSFTTTDIGAAVQVAAGLVEEKGASWAVVAIVATETERQASWSRLDGLLLHWATAQSGNTETWVKPAKSFKTVPSQTEDVGGAYESKFEKSILEGGSGNTSVFSLILKLPLEGPLATGGVVGVLKSGGEGNPTRWLKDISTGKDFFFQLSTFPKLKK